MIETRKLEKSFQDGDREAKVLKGIDFVAKDGEFIAVIGRSGAGKSTFLYQLSLLDEPTAGEILIDGRSTKDFSQKEGIYFRLREFGYVFQDYALLPDLTACENVSLPLIMQGMGKKEARERALHELGRMNVGHHADNLPAHLSGGEQQRVSIARAIVNRPKILFADEPTANLDRESSETVLNIFQELHESGQTIVMVTHEEEYARYAERIITIDDGKIVSDTRV